MKCSEPPSEGGDRARRYRFDDVEVDVPGHTVVRDGLVRPLEPKAFAVLALLLSRPGQLLGRDELLDGVWGHRHVTPGVLTRAIAQVRSALGDDPHDPRYIQTQHSVGYRFIGILEADGQEPPEVSPPPSPADPLPLESLTPAPVGAPGTSPGRRHDDAHPRLQPRVLHDRRAPARPRWRGWIAASVVALTLALAAWIVRPPAPPPAPTPAPPPRASIAVMPFSNLGPDRDDDYFAEGLALELHDALAGVEGLVVAARISPALAARSESDVRAIGERVGVATVLDATVRREGSRLRINARLSDTGSGYTLWSRAYDRELVDVFATQSEIASEVVTALLGVIPETHAQLTDRLTPTNNLAAFDAYLRGLQQLRLSGSSGSVDTAVGFFNRALSEDDGFVRAQAGICRSELARFTGLRSAEAFEAARTACARAREMDPGAPEVELALGDLHLAQARYDEAMAHYERARQDPAQAPSAYVGMARVHAALQQHAQALPLFMRAIELRPGSASIHGWLGYEQYLAGDLEGAIGSFQDALRLEPGDAGMWSTLGGLQLLAGEPERAMQAFEQSIRIQPTGAVLSNYGALKMQSGEYAQAATLFSRALELEPGDFLIHGHLGDALLAQPETSAQATGHYRHAARMAQDYVDINPGDARALAAWGWYLANLGEPAQARALVERSEARAGIEGSVALINAQTLSRIGTEEEVLARVDQARQAGISESMITSNAFLRHVPGIDPSTDESAR